MTIIEAIAENKLRLAIGNFLSKVLFKNKFFELDIWMFMHTLFGAGIMFVLNLFKLKARWRYTILLSILIGFEIIEYFLYTNLTTLFIPESFVNVFWDIVFGVGGAGLVDLGFFIKKNYRKVFKD